MTPKPLHARIAKPTDAEHLFALVVESENEWALSGRSYDRVRAVIALAVDRSPLVDVDGSPMMRPAFGVIDGPLGIEAGCGIYPTQPWDSDQTYLRGFWLYVHAACRKTTHAKSLLQFGNWFSDVSGMPLVWELLHPEKVQAKMALFSRSGGTLVGGLFIHEPSAEAIAA
jgi:hypothetical protein